MRAEISSCDFFPSDTHMLVESCIARVRVAARLDDDAVLPPLPQVTPRRDVVIFTKSQTEAAAASGSSATVLAVLPAPPAPPQRRSGRWAFRLCALVAVAAASAAFLASPAGHRPGVERVTRAARLHVSNTAHATLALVSRR